MDVANITEEKEAVCRPILEALPQWFGIKDAREQYISEAGDLTMFACMDGKAASALTHSKLFIYRTDPAAIVMSR